jgi:hypothetical protein
LPHFSDILKKLVSQKLRFINAHLAVLHGLAAGLDFVGVAVVSPGGVPAVLFADTAASLPIFPGYSVTGAPLRMAAPMVIK